MKIKQWLKASQSQLQAADIPTARLDCLVLLEDALQKDRAYLLAHDDIELSSHQQDTLRQQLTARSQHTPLAYIRGKTEFFGREFIINKDVLEPRPESEAMIELLKKLPDINMQEQHIIDVGSGSGALAITAKLELPQATVTGVDIDPACLKVARQNAQKHQVTVTFNNNDLINNIIIHPRTALLCNLPYIPDKFTLNQAAMNEPKIAIFGGKDGLDHYRKLFKQIDKLQQKPVHILTESLPFQHNDLCKIASQSGYTQAKEDDFIQLFSCS